VRDEQGQPVLLAATSSPQASPVTTKTQAPPKTVHTSGNVAWTGTPDPSAPCSVWSISPQTGKPAINRTGKVPAFVAMADNALVNGIRQDANAALSKAAGIAYEIGKPVDLIYNPTEGPIQDIYESMMELTTGNPTDFTRTLLSYKIRKDLPNGIPLFLMGHSQGSISVLNALRLYVEEEYKNLLESQKAKSPEDAINIIKKQLKNVRIVLMGSPVNFDKFLHRVAWVDLPGYGRKKLKDLLQTTDLNVGDSLTNDQKGLVQQFWQSGGILSLRHENDFVAQVLPKADEKLLRALCNPPVTAPLDPDLAKTISSLIYYTDKGSIQHTAVYFDLLLRQVFHPY
jgi:hypothetical protein